MSSISNNTTIPSATTIHMLTANSQDPVPSSAHLYQALDGLRLVLTILLNSSDTLEGPAMDQRLKDDTNMLLLQYCQYAGPDQDQLNQALQKAGLVEIGTSPYLQPSSHLKTALEDKDNMSFIMSHVIPEINAVLEQLLKS